MVFGRAWSEVFEDLEQGRLMRDPSFLVSLPSQTDPSLAPEGRSAAYVLFPTPNLESGQVDWDRMRGPYREHMLSTIEAAGWTGFGDAIDAEVLITPQDWADRGTGGGHAVRGGAHVQPDRAVPGAQHPRRQRRLRRVGHGPGVGVPMVLVSGRLAAERVTGRDPGYRSRAWR